jgi:hypothetical protein
MLLNKKSIALLSMLAISGASILLGPVVSHAAGISAGRAVIHIDARTATVTQQADGSYEIAMPKGTIGQWMGDRTSANGKKRVRVGYLTGEELVSGWKKFRYISSGIGATLVWEPSCGQFEHVAVHVVGKPRRTATGVTFTVTSRKSLPSTLKDVSIHLQRAPKKGFIARPMTANISSSSDAPYTVVIDQTVTILDNLMVSSNINTNTPNNFSVTIHNGSNQCWSHAWNNINNQYEASVGSNTCDLIYYTDYYTGSQPYGAGASPYNPDPHTYITLAVTPPGEAAYYYHQDFPISE